MRRETGQTATEYLIVFAAALAVIGIATSASMINPGTRSAHDTLYLSQARTAADLIAQAIDSVYANGPSAVTSAGVSVDVGWSLYLDNATNSVVVSVSTSDGLENVSSSVRYPIDNYLSASLSFGFQTVMVEWPPGGSESLVVVPENRVLYIRICPTGYAG